MTHGAPYASRIRPAGLRRKSKPGRTREETAFARQLRRNVSKTEKRLWKHLENEQLGAPFRRQHVVGGAFPDYCCVPLKLIVEVDGPMHDLGRDAARDERMNLRGYDVIRFGVQDLDRDLQGVVDTIHREVQMRLLAKGHVPE